MVGYEEGHIQAYRLKPLPTGVGFDSKEFKDIKV